MERPLEAAVEGDGDGGAPAPGAVDLLVVEPLDEASADAVVAAAIGQAPLYEDVFDRVKRAAAGNPLFIEQFLTMLIDDGMLVPQEGGGWVLIGDLDRVRVPPTVEAVLAARVDSLEDAERSALEPASVMGREFSSRAIRELSETALDTDTALTALIGRQLIVPARDPDVIEDYRFRNLLLRDVVYDGLLKRTRSGLHQRFADWLEAFSASLGRSTEVQEIIGYHLEQAYHLRAGLGALDAEATGLGHRAADRLAPAGLRAFTRGDMPAAANLLERAAAVLPDDEPTRPRLLARAAEARFETGEFKRSIELYDRAESVATGAGDRIAAGIAELGRLRLRYLTGDGVADGEARDLVERLTPIFVEAGDHRALAGCGRLIFNVELTHSQWTAAGRAAELMIEEARKAGDELLERRGLPALAGVAMYGPTPVPEAIERCRAVLTRAGDDRATQAYVERFMAHLLAFDGRSDEARALITATRDRLTELGWRFDAAIVALSHGPIEILAGRPDLAVQELQAAYDTLRSMGEQNFITTVGAYLAEAIRQTGHPDEAIRLADEAAATAAEDDTPTQVAWRAARAKAMLDPADADAAERLIAEAVKIALGTDDIAMQGDTFLDQGTVLARLGRTDAARSSIEAALERFRAKQHRVGEGLATQALGALGAARGGS
jgi:tetratricopeptide (TPR) repeat protein